MPLFSELKYALALGLKFIFFKHWKFEGRGEENFAGFFQPGVAIGKFQLLRVDGSHASVRCQNFRRNEVIADLPPERTGIARNPPADRSGDACAECQIAEVIPDRDACEVIEQRASGNGHPAGICLDFRFLRTKPYNNAVEAFVRYHEIGTLSDYKKSQVSFVKGFDERGQRTG